MCLVVVAHRVRADLPLVLVANRDEMHARPTAPMQWWPAPSLLAGRDLQAGGTWFATDARGRFAVITNVRGRPAPPGAPSRGDLVPRFVAGAATPLGFLAALGAEGARYAGFNLLVGDPDGIAWWSNADPRPPRLLPAGIHALSNGLPGADWPKERAARTRLEDALSGAPPAPEGLFEVLASRTPAADAGLPDTGVGRALERALSPPFIVGAEYGTRGTTVLVRDAGGATTVLERSFDAAGAATGLRHFAFPPAA